MWNNKAAAREKKNRRGFTRIKRIKKIRLTSENPRLFIFFTVEMIAYNWPPKIVKLAMCKFENIVNIYLLLSPHHPLDTNTMLLNPVL